MKLREFNFPPEWYEDEVREGFFVSSTMKRFWAGQLEVLKIIDEMCEKLGVHWYADWGTLLGVIRHHGFIPWDDDIDICMYRRDLEILRAHAREMVPEGYHVLDPRDNEEIENDIFRIVSSNKLDVSKEYLDQYHIPFSVGIDIFALDNYSNDEAYENKRSEISKALLDCIVYQKKKTVFESEEEYIKQLRFLQEETGTDFSASKQIGNAMCIERLNLDMRVTDETTSKVKVFYDDGTVFDRDWFGEPAMLLFEGIEIPVPAEAEKVLEAEFGNRKYIDKGSAGHSYPCFTEQEETFKESSGSYPYRYTFKEEDLQIQRPQGPSQKAEAVLSTLSKTVDALVNHAGEDEVRLQLLMGLQKILVAFSADLTPLFPNNMEIANSLRVFGEEIFQAFSEWQSESSARLRVACDEMTGNVREAFRNRKVIVFLPCRATWWKAMEPLWKYASKLKGAEVYVCPIPWYEEPQIGMAGEKHDETDLFPAEIAVTSILNININELQPTAIVTQVPYDNLSPFMQIDDCFSSNNLRNFTDKLIYVPCFLPDDPENDICTAAKALKYLIEQPAVVYADEVRVPTSRMRQVYVETLVSCSSEECRTYWEEKIKAEDKTELSLRDTVFSNE